MQYVFDLKRNRALWVAEGIAEDGVTGELFAVDDSSQYDERFIPIMKKSYHTIVDGMTHFFESRMLNDECLAEINTELQKYGI